MKIFNKNIINFAFINLFLCSIAFANDPVVVRDWPADIWNDLRKYTRDGRIQLSNVVFDAIDDLKLANIGLGSDHAKVEIFSKREVFNNHDVLKTWTVIDRFKINFGFPFEFSINQPLPNWIPDLNFSIGHSNGVEWSFLKIVPEKSELYPIQNEVLEVQDSPWFKDLKNINTKKPDEQTLSESLGTEDDILITPGPLPIDPAFKPRYKKLLSRLVTTFKIPRRVKGFIEKLNDGEMVSYYGYGAVDTSVGVDWDLLDDTVTKTQLNIAELSASFYIKGGFKISILRENERYARVKRSAIFDRGDGQSFTLGKVRQQLFEGIVVLDNSVGKIRQVLKPFQIQRKKDIAHFTDHVYRYDLQDPIAVDAFEEAIRGRFKKSQALSESTIDLKEKPVELFATRTAKRDAKHKPRNIQLFFVKYKKDKYTEIFDGRIQLPTGEQHIFKSQNAKTYSYRTLWGVSEATTHQFTISINNKMGAFVTAETFLDDSRTRRSEINQYLKEAELVTGQDTVLPRVPNNIHFSRKDPIFGKSSFYFGYHLDPKSLNFLSKVPYAQKVEHLLLAFKALEHETQVNPKTIELLVKRWELLSLWSWDKRFLTDLEFSDANKTLNEVFSDQRYNRELMIAFRIALSCEPLDYFVSIQNPVLGAIYERGQFQPDIERLRKYTDSEIGFEGIRGQSGTDPDASIDDWKVSELPLKVSFKTHSEPHVIYFQLNRLQSNGAIGEEIYKRVVVNKSSHFKKGWNHLVLNGEPEYSIDQEIFAVLNKEAPGNRYSLSVTYSIDKIYWGVPVPIKFTIPLQP